MKQVKFDIRTGMVIPENGVKLQDLGNPGKQYEATRHNMGFDTVDCLVEKHNIPQGGVKFNAMYGKSIIGGEKADSDETAFLYEPKRRSCS